MDTYFHNKLVVLLFYFCCLEDSDNILQLRLSSSLRDIKKKSKFCTFTFLYLLPNFFDIKTCEETIVVCFYSFKLYTPPRNFLQ